MGCVCLSNLRILQKVPSPAPASPAEQWQERPLCLGPAGSCGSTLVGHILGFGEDELGEHWDTTDRCFFVTLSLVSVWSILTVVKILASVFFFREISFLLSLPLEVGAF